MRSFAPALAIRTAASTSGKAMERGTSIVSRVPVTAQLALAREGLGPLWGGRLARRETRHQ